MDPVDVPTPIRIFLVRHGESAANEQPEIRSTTPEPKIDLTPRGWKQALTVGAYLKSYFEKHPPSGKIALLHGSLNRQRETAQGIIQAVGDRISVCIELDNLNEQSFGVVGGKAKDSWQDHFPEFAAAQQMLKQANASYFFRFPGGESREDVGRRCREVANEIRQAQAEGITDFVVVTSSIPMRAMVKELLGLRYEDLNEESSPHNCDVRLIEGNVDKGYILRDGQPQNAVTIPHKTDREHFLDGDYFPPCARGAMPMAGSQLATAHL